MHMNKDGGKEANYCKLKTEGNHSVGGCCWFLHIGFFYLIKANSL